VVGSEVCEVEISTSNGGVCIHCCEGLDHTLDAKVCDLENVVALTRCRKKS